MITKEQVKSDLRDIRHYYSHKEFFDNMEKTIGANPYKQKAQKYTLLICESSARLFELYIHYYIEGHTLEESAYDMSFSVEYIRQGMDAILKFLVKRINSPDETIISDW